MRLKRSQLKQNVKTKYNTKQTIMLSNSNASGGIGFGGLLTIVFIILKLTDHIDWSWWWVLSPLWIPIAFIIIVLLIVVLFKTITS